MGKKANIILVAVIIVAVLFIAMELSGPQESSQGYTITYPAEHTDETVDISARSHRDFSLSSKGQYQVSVSANGTVDVEVYSRGELTVRKNEVRSTTLNFFNETQAAVVRVINGALLQGRTVRIVIDKEYYEEWVPD